MQTHEIILLYDYNYWANQRILQATERVSPEQFVAPTSHTYGSLHGTLLHILSAEWIWRSRWQGDSPTAMLDPADFPTLAALRARWDSEEQQMRAFLAALRDQNLASTVQYATTSGRPSSQILWQVMLHVVLHGMQHRSEAAAILTDYGQSPGDIDLIVFLREQG
jgi:uncharacterized damage-inducible protein DinB